MRYHLWSICHYVCLDCFMWVVFSCYHYLAISKTFRTPSHIRRQLLWFKVGMRERGVWTALRFFFIFLLKCRICASRACNSRNKVPPDWLMRKLCRPQPQSPTTHNFSLSHSLISSLYCFSETEMNASIPNPHHTHLSLLLSHHHSFLSLSLIPSLSLLWNGNKCITFLDKCFMDSCGLQDLSRHWFNWPSHRLSLSFSLFFSLLITHFKFLPLFSQPPTT